MCPRVAASSSGRAPRAKHFFVRQKATVASFALMATGPVQPHRNRPHCSTTAMPMTRSEVADRADVNPETVRYYERRGLIPDPPRSSAGYRQYDASHVDRLRFIKRAQELGFTLSEIEDLLGLRVASGSQCDEVRTQAEAKIEDVEAKIRDLRRIRDALTELVDACAQQQTTGPCPILDAMDDDVAFAQVTTATGETPAHGTSAD